MSLDKTDERIVAALIEDARASYATIGSLVGLSAPAVKRRVDRLLEAGAIRGFTARVDPAALGWTTEAYVELFCRALTSPADIRAAVRRYPEVVGACTVTGEADALLHIQAADVGHFGTVVAHAQHVADAPQGEADDQHAEQHGKNDVLSDFAEFFHGLNFAANWGFTRGACLALVPFDRKHRHR